MLLLYHNDMSTCAQKIRCQLAEKEIDWEGRELNLRAGDQHKPEFLRINPKGVVPVLVHENVVINESNIIMEYIEEAFSDAPSLMPSSPVAKAGVRAWLQRLDTGLHLDIAVLSIAISFRHQLLAVNNTPELLNAYYEAMPNLKLRAIYEEVVPDGADASSFAASLQAWRTTLLDMEQQLKNTAWLAGDGISIADFALLPYLCRLDHLQLGFIWNGLPNILLWRKRIEATKGYRQGIEKWLNPKYLELMKATGAPVQGKAASILGISIN